MQHRHGPLADMPLETAIALRWSLRDVHARRLTISPLDPSHRDVLLERGLIESNDAQQLVLTEAGRKAIGEGDPDYAA